MAPPPGLATSAGAPLPMSTLRQTVLRPGLGLVAQIVQGLRDLGQATETLKR
jgi:hypothetical protein